MKKSADPIIQEKESANSAYKQSEMFLRRIGRPVLFFYPKSGRRDMNGWKAVYACLNYNEAFCPKQIEKQSICLDGDAGVILDLIK